MTFTKLMFLAVVALAGTAFVGLDLGPYVSLASLQQRQDELALLYAQRPWTVAMGYFLVYVLVATLSLPGAAVLTLAGGALFGLWKGLLIVSFASSLGATLAFLMARYFFRDSLQSRFGSRLADIHRGIQRDGAFYLLTLRLVPLVPFFVINLVMGLTQMPVFRFYGVSQLGMLAGTAVYVNAGTHLAQIHSLQDVLSPGVWGALILLAAFPWLARKLLALLQQRQVYARWAADRPRVFDRNLIVIGGGAGGLVSAYIAAAVKAKVTLVEAHQMGGDCLNHGCVPSKALIQSAAVAHQMRRASRYGLQDVVPGVLWPALMRRVQDVIRAIEPHDSVARYTGLGVEVLQGHARIVNPWTVAVTLNDGGTRTLTSRSLVIATGARPIVPPLPGLEEVGYLTSDTLWAALAEMPAPPGRMVVLGGGPIGCELAQSFARLGSTVTVVETAPRLLVREDEEVSALVRSTLQAEGITVLTGHTALRCEWREGVKWLWVQSGEGAQALAFDVLLCAVGRAARLSGYGLEELGIPVQKTVETNAYLQTLYPNIYAVGDVAGPLQFTHMAAHQAWYAAVNALFGTIRRFKVDDRVVPRATFTDPEVARVGLNEQEAEAQGMVCEVTRYRLDGLDRAIVDGATQGFVKVLTVPGKDRILGVTIVGPHAADLLAEYVLAMKHGLGLNKVLGTIHTYPTMSEANRYVAGEWKRAHQPERLLRWIARYHAWRRG